jgi:hypothetical protein
MCICAVFEIFFLYVLVREVNEELKQQGKRPILKSEYGWRFFSRIFKEHERLFPASSKRTWWVLVFVLSVIGFIVADFFW